MGGSIMASIIKSTTTDGIQIIPDSTGAFAIQTNGANTALTIDTSQNATFAKNIILNGSTSGTITLAAPATAGSNTITLPANTGTVLTSASSLTASQLPAGSVLQVVSTTKTDTTSFASSSFTDITGLSVSITPSSASNKIFVFVSVGLISTVSNQALSIAFRLMRGATAIAVGDAAGSRLRASFRVFTPSDSNHGRSASFSCVDSPSSTSSITYALQASSQDAQTTYINRTASDSDGTNAYQARCASTITVMEIKG